MNDYQVDIPKEPVVNVNIDVNYPRWLHVAAIVFLHRNEYARHAINCKVINLFCSQLIGAFQQPTVNLPIRAPHTAVNLHMSVGSVLEAKLRRVHV